MTDLEAINQKLAAIFSWCEAHHHQSEVLQVQLEGISSQLESIENRLEHIEEALDLLLGKEEAERRIHWVIQRWQQLRIRKMSPRAASMIWWYLQWRLHGPDESQYEPIPLALIEEGQPLPRPLARTADNQPASPVRPRPKRLTTSWEIKG